MQNNDELPALMQNTDEFRNLKYDVDRAICYHNLRTGFFRAWHRRAMLAIVVALCTPVLALIGPAVDFLNLVAGKLGISEVLSLAAVASMISFVGILAAFSDVMANTGDNAAMHRACEIIYKNIRSDLLTCETEADLRSLKNRYERVDSGFEVRHVIVNLVSRNQVRREIGLDELPISWWQWWFMHYNSFSATKVT